MEVVMAKKAQAGEVNKSAEIRALLKANPKITAKEVADTLALRGIRISPNLFYFIKGRMKGSKVRRRKRRQNVANIMATSGATAKPTSGDVLVTIKKIKGLAAEVGGLRRLRALVEALSE
jgi:hypothetical protein